MSDELGKTHLFKDALFNQIVVVNFLKQTEQTAFPSFFKSQTAMKSNSP